jgi:hypothetical protein
MTSLRQKVLVWTSAMVVALAFVVLPGCSKKPTPTKPTQQKKATDKATKGME